jgi:hypothetical protein
MSGLALMAATAGWRAEPILAQLPPGTPTYSVNAKWVTDKGSQVYNVLAYGAKCDGVTDDSAAIQAAINAANAGAQSYYWPAGVVLIPGGCAIGSTLTARANLRGVGQQVAIPPSGYQRSFLKWIGAASQPMVDIPIWHVSIEHLAFEGNATNPPSTAILIDDSGAGSGGAYGDYAHIHDVYIGNFTGEPLGTFVNGISWNGTAGGDSDVLDFVSINGVSGAAINNPTNGNASNITISNLSVSQSNIAVLEQGQQINGINWEFSLDTTEVVLGESSSPTSTNPVVTVTGYSGGGTSNQKMVVMYNGSLTINGGFFGMSSTSSNPIIDASGVVYGGTLKLKDFRFANYGYPGPTIKACPSGTTYNTNVELLNVNIGPSQIVCSPNLSTQGNADSGLVHAQLSAGDAYYPSDSYNILTQETGGFDPYRNDRLHEQDYWGGPVVLHQLPTPYSVTCTPTGTGSTTYAYRVTAVAASANYKGETLPSTEITCQNAATLNSTTNYNTITVNPTEVGATGYNFYCRTSGSEQLCTPTPVSDYYTAANSTPFPTWVDNGSATPSGAMPTVNTTGEVLGVQDSPPYWGTPTPRLNIGADGHVTGTAGKFSSLQDTGLISASSVATDSNGNFIAGSGGGGSMTWPSGGAGIPNYSGSGSWGTTYNASNQIPANFISTLNQNTTGSAASLSISGQTALLSFTGLTSTNRVKTVRDAADTLLELGGSYTPTGTWNWQTASVTWPTLNQSTTGNAATATSASQLNGGPVPASANGLSTNSSSQLTASTAHNQSVIAACATTNSGNAYSCTTSPNFTPAAGDQVLVDFNAANTGSATLNVNGAGAVTLYKWGNTATLVSGDIQAGHYIRATYDGSHWQLEGQLGNTNLAGTGYPYNPSAGSTSMLPLNTANNDAVLTSTGNGTSNTATALKNAPALSAANMTSFPQLTQNTQWNACSTPTYGAGGTTPVNWATSNCTSITASGGNTTFSVSNPYVGLFDFRVIQGTTAYNYTFPSNMVGFQISDAPSSITDCYDLFDGTNFRNPLCISNAGYSLGIAQSAPNGTPSITNSIWSWLDSTTATPRWENTSGQIFQPVAGCTSGCGFAITHESQTEVSPAGGGAYGNSANNIHFLAWYNLNTKVLGAKAMVDVMTSQSGSHFDAGVYSLSGTTLTLRWHLGQQSGATAGGVYVTGLTPYTLIAGQAYYLATCSDTTTLQLSALASPLQSPSSANPFTLALGGTNAPAHTYGLDSTDSCTSGTLPSSATSTNITNATTGILTPFVYVQN